MSPSCRLVRKKHAIPWTAIGHLFGKSSLARVGLRAHLRRLELNVAIGSVCYRTFISASRGGCQFPLSRDKYSASIASGAVGRCSEG